MKKRKEAGKPCAALTREKVTRVQQGFADALRAEEFYPVYQPKVDIRTGRFAGRRPCAAVDDYGMGYSSLNLVKNIPWNVLKIDRSVLPANEEDYRGKHGIMLKHVVAMFKEIGLECVAEGVETEDQLKLLKEAHCDLVQGYLFYRPMSAEDFEKKLAEQM